MGRVAEVFTAIDRVACDVEKSAQDLFPDGNGNAGAGVFDVDAPAQPFCGVKQDAANGVVANMLGNFHCVLFTVMGSRQRVFDLWQFSTFKGHVDDSAHHLCDFPFHLFFSSFLSAVPSRLPRFP